MYRKSITAKKYERKAARCAVMRAAKERKRLEAPGADWTTHEHLLRFAISPDGRHVALAMPNGWQRCGSERTIRAALARAIWTRTAA